MPSVLRELPLTYAVLSAARWCATASAVDEPSPASQYRVSSAASAGPSGDVIPPRRPLTSSTERVRLHLKPGQKGTKQLLARYGDRLICVRYRYDVAFIDVAVRDRVKQAGGTWNPERRLWQLRYDRVVALGLKSRIVDEPASNTGYPPARGEHLSCRCPDSI